MSDDALNLRKTIFSRYWPLDEELTTIASALPSHRFLYNPAGQYAYIYLTQYIKAFAERHFAVPFDNLTVLDWGCGKGHVTKLIGDLHPQKLVSCDILSERDDSTFGQATPLIDHFNITVTPLTHESNLPFPDATFDIVVSFGVLEHVPNDQASIAEIVRVLKPNGLFFCFYLPTKLSWTQKVARSRGDEYHDRLYTESSINRLLTPVHLQLRDLWYRQMFPKNAIAYPSFRTFEHIDQWITRHTPLRYIATGI